MITIHVFNMLLHFHKSWRNWQKIRKNNKIKPFIDKYNWKVVDYPLEKDDWKKPEKNNPTIVNK